MVATVRLVARSMRVTASSRGAPRSPGATLAIHNAHRRRRWPQRAQGRAVARRRPRWSPGRSGPSCRRRPAPKGPRRPRSRTRRREGDGRGEPAAVEGGDGDPGAGGRGWRLGRSRGARGVGDVCACGCGKQHRDDQRLVPAWSAKRRRPEVGGVGMAQLPSQGSRVEHPSYPHRMGPAILERNEASRIRRRGTGRVRGSSPTRRRRILAVAWSGHRWCGSFSDPRGQFVGAIAFTRGCERNFWSFAQTTWV